mmetsp:Transcript_10422/g.10274  ORF Transcript_10422/g.10274 Transcript_10422/m.10274 type:complete len:276 (-) Transcript_10422:33-860(-)|eukprot:CAMPEP_0197008794 /NCGR_PEP_ID=MMETSP1380-20130617/46930_1 /TAXON_ID=5936 /ORGANISM="Euplotes crassus, Strain CT5" /LENGTH=275 /DNA_ID=CAMNT_0042429599 /DNA_START=378 /DNA_END=1205 /DNA_ORIENTATION=+
MQGSGKIFKKAIDNTKNKAPKKEQSSDKGPKSFVKTGEDGRKIIMRPKSKGAERGYKQDRSWPKEKSGKFNSDKSGEIKSNKDNKLLDLDLDSIIKKQKAQKKEEQEEEEEQDYQEYQGYEHYQAMPYYPRGYSRGRGSYRGRGKRGGFKPRTNEDHNNDDEPEEKQEGEGQDDATESHKPKRGGYKGKNYNPYYDPSYQAMYGAYNYMYGYPMMPSQGYYQPGHKNPKFGQRGKNMKWSKDMDQKKTEDTSTKKRDVKDLEKQKEGANENTAKS